MESTGRPPTLGGDSLSEFAFSFAQTAQALFAAGDVSATLASVGDHRGLRLCRHFLDREGQGKPPPVNTDPIVVEIDRAQHTTGEGPRATRLLTRSPNAIGLVRRLRVSTADTADFRAQRPLPISSQRSTCEFFSCDPKLALP
jgi:hypothetical protein